MCIECHFIERNIALKAWQRKFIKELPLVPTRYMNRMIARILLKALCNPEKFARAKFSIKNALEFNIGTRRPRNEGSFWRLLVAYAINTNTAQYLCAAQERRFE